MRTLKLSARLVVALALLLVHPAVSSDRAVEAARDYRAAHGHEILSSFAEFLAIPNVAMKSGALIPRAPRLRARIG